MGMALQKPREECVKIEETLSCHLCQKLPRNWIRDAGEVTRSHKLEVTGDTVGAFLVR